MPSDCRCSACDCGVRVERPRETQKLIDELSRKMDALTSENKTLKVELKKYRDIAEVMKELERKKKKR